MSVTGGISLRIHWRLPENVESIRGFRWATFVFFLAVSFFISTSSSKVFRSSSSISFTMSPNRVGLVFLRFGGFSTGLMCFRRSLSLIFQEPWSEIWHLGYIPHSRLSPKPKWNQHTHQACLNNTRNVAICIGNHMDRECNLGIIARATGKVITWAIASAIYACCECNYSQIAREYMWLNTNHILPGMVPWHGRKKRLSDVDTGDKPRPSHNWVN